MKNLRIFLLILAAVVALTGFSWLGYNLFRRFHRPAESPFNAIPGNTALIIQLNKAGNLLEELNRSNLLWKALTRFPGINVVRNELRFVDSASRKNEQINDVLQKHNLLISITLSGHSNFGALYLATVNNPGAESYIADFVKEVSNGKATITETPYYTTTLQRIQFRGSRDAFYFAVLKGIFLGSFHSDLVKRAIDRLSLNTPLAASAGFRKVQASSGKKVDANIYINYRFFSLVLSRLTMEDRLPDLIKLSNFADWSGLDVIIKKDELLFNGITVASDSSQQYLSLFSDQKPQKTLVTSILPDRVIYFTRFGWSDPARFTRRFQNRTPHEESFTGEQSAAARLIDQFQLNISEYYLPWIGNEGCYFALQDPRTQQEISYAAFSTADTARALAVLRSLADTLGIRTDSLQSAGHRIYKMALPAFLPALFGDVFGKVEARCFTFLNGYIVFAALPKEFEPLFSAARDKLTLDNDKAYRDFENSLSDKSNVYCYFSTRNALGTLKSIMSQDLASQMNPMMDSLRKFESVAFQFTNAEGLFYSNIFLRYNPNLGKEGPLEWQARLDSTLTGRPVIIRPTPAGNASVVATDSANNLYMIGSDGRISWKLHIMGTILGGIHPIRITGHDSLFLVFNTDTHLYLLSFDGRYADKFPMRFPLHATNGLTFTDWGEKGNYNIMVAFQDNRIYSFTLDGISVPGWKRPALQEEITDPVTVQKSPSGWYLMVTGRTGSTLIADRHGNRGIIPEPKFVHSPSSGFYQNRTARKGIFLTTDPNGKVVFIQENGHSSEVTLNLFSPDHRFFYADITGNGHPEFIFVDRDKIFYYNQSFKLIYSYQFRHKITSPPFMLSGDRGKVMIGLTVPEMNELFLFDEQGNHELESGIRGSIPYDIGTFEPGGTMSLVTGSGNMVRSYRLPKTQ